MKEYINKVLSVILTVVLILMTTYPAFAATSIDPALEWRTIETRHFNIHYYPATASAAQRAASFMEDVHTNLLNVIKKEPEGKTNIVLLDNTDMLNGDATPFPSKRINIFLSPWVEGKHEEWLKMVLIHEYTHILHTDRTEGETEIVRKIFGNVIFAYDLMQPSWSQEGLAVYNETRFTTGGRGVDPFVNMRLRSQFIEGQELSQEQVNGYIMTRKMLGANYLYGAKLWQYIANTYGEDKLDKITELYAQYPLAGFPVAVRNATGDDLDTIWNRFNESMRATYTKQVEEIKAQGLTVSAQLTHSKYGANTFPQWSNDGKTLYYHSATLDSEPQIRKINIDTGKDEQVFETSALHSDFKVGGNNIVYSKMNPYNNYYYYNDLYSYDIKEKKIKQLTSGARGADPAISPDGKKIVYVANQSGNHNLMLLENGKTKPLTNLTGVIFTVSAFSPDGDKLAIERNISGHTEICIVDMSGNIAPIVEDKNRTTNITPRWSPDGRYILFSSDRTGVFNLYAYDTQLNKLYQITNVVTGATTPSVSPDGKKIAFAQYSYLGWDIHVMSYDPASWKEVPVVAAGSGEMGTQIRDDALLAASESKEIKTYESKPYNPLPTLMPTWWTPLPVFDGKGYGIGAMTFNNDVLNKHSYSIMAGTGPAGRPVYDVSYRNDQFPPSITFNISDSANWVQRHEIKSLKVSYQHNIDMDTAQLFSIGYANDNVTNIASTTATPGILSGIQLGYAYSHIHRYYNSISNEEGYTFGLNVNINSKGMGSTFDTTVYTADSKVYFPLSENHQVLAVRATWVTSTGDPLGIYNYTIFLRGYPYGYLAGSGLWRGTAEYRFPISFIESGPHGYPFNLLYLDRQWGSFFVDSGEASGGFVAVPGVKTSAGAQYNIDTKLVYNIPMTFSVYYAYGFNDNVGSQFGFNLSTPFLAGSW